MTVAKVVSEYWAAGSAKPSPLPCLKAPAAVMNAICNLQLSWVSTGAPLQEAVLGCGMLIIVEDFTLLGYTYEVWRMGRRGSLKIAVKRA